MEQLVWNIYARVYDSILPGMSPYQQMIRQVYEALDPKKGDCFLDAGCGTGNYMLPFFDTGNDIELVGVDYSAAMLRRAQKKLKGREGKAIFHELDLNEELPFAKGSFKGITCINVLYAIKTPEVLLQELYRVLDSEGKLILITPLSEPKILPILVEHLGALKVNYPKLWRLVFFCQFVKLVIPAMIFIPINLYIKGNSRYHFFSENDIKSLLASHGFHIHEIGLIYGQQNWFIIAEKAHGSTRQQEKNQEE